MALRSLGVDDDGEHGVADLERLGQRCTRLAQRQHARRMTGQIHQDIVAADAGHRPLDGLPGTERPYRQLFAFDLGQQLSHGLGGHTPGGGI